MKRATTKVQADLCDSCHGSVLTTNWDDLEDVTVDYIADPTPLGLDEQIDCIVAGRRLFYLEQTIARTFRLSWRNSSNETRTLPAVVAILPAHRCGSRYDTALPVDVAIALTGGTSAPLPDEPVWATA